MQLGRFLESERAGERFSLLVGLVLGHSVVRWLIVFAVAATIVLAALQVPAVRAAIKTAFENGRLTISWFDALIGLTIGLLMALLSLFARWLASDRV